MTEPLTSPVPPSTPPTDVIVISSGEDDDDVTVISVAAPDSRVVKKEKVMWPLTKTFIISLQRKGNKARDHGNMQ